MKLMSYCSVCWPRCSGISKSKVSSAVLSFSYFSSDNLESKGKGKTKMKKREKQGYMRESNQKLTGQAPLRGVPGYETPHRNFYLRGLLRVANTKSTTQPGGDPRVAGKGSLSLV